MKPLGWEENLLHSLSSYTWPYKMQPEDAGKLECAMIGPFIEPLTSSGRTIVPTDQRIAIALYKLPLVLPRNRILTYANYQLIHLSQEHKILMRISEFMRISCVSIQAFICVNSKFA